MKTLLLIDGNSILNRAFYGIRPLTNSSGLFTHAVYGMTNIVLKHIETEKPDYCAVAFDLKAPTFRHKLYAQYKATRKGMPEELAVQLPYAKEAMSALGIRLIEAEGFEADDILGTCSMFSLDNSELMSYILTGDKDSFQLIRDNVNVLYASTGETVRFDREAFEKKYPGICPEQFVDVKALMGDSSDNIPGVAGIGEKTAVSLISEFGSLDKVYENLESASIKPAARKKLAEGKECAYLSRTLAEIKTDTPLNLTLDDLECNGIDEEKCIDLFQKLELASIMKKLKLSLKKSDPAKKSEPEATENAEYIPSLVLKDDLSAVIYNRDSEETADQDTVKKLLLDPEKAFAVLDSKAICNRLKITEYKCRLFDLSLAGYLLSSSDNDYSLSRLSIKYLSEYDEGSKENEPSLIYRLYPVLKQRLAETGQLKLYEEIELPLAPVLSSMEQTGSKIDREGLENFLDKLTYLCNEYATDIYDEVGYTFNLNSPKQLGEVLFVKLGLPSSKKTKTGYATDAETLERLRPFSTVVDRLLEYRTVSKLKSTYAEGLLKALDSKSRVHTKFNQTVTATGRLSSTDPNLQNIPIRTPLGREIRKFFIPENENYVFVDADYSQIELRLLAAISGDEKMIEAFKKGADIHTHTAAQIFGLSDEEVTPEQRKKAKAVNFGIVYGIGGFSLAQDIGTSVYEANEYIKNYLANYPKVQSYLKSIVELARADGFVTTLFGRRRYIPELASPKKQLQAFGERVALNSPIQGTAADIIKIAMINVDKALKSSGIDAKIVLQVHDEIILESHRDCAKQAAEILKKEMEGAVNLSVPMLVDIDEGSTWFEC